MIKENLFVYIEWSPVKHVASAFSIRKNVTKKEGKRKEHLYGVISPVHVDCRNIYLEVSFTAVY